MTVIRLRGLHDAIPAPALADTTATVQRWAGRNPAPIFNGADVILPAEVAIDVNAQTITLPATDGRFCIRWVITGADVAPVIRYTAIPAAAAVDFADLIDVDPRTFKPTGAATSAWLAAVSDVRDLTETAVESATASGKSAFNAGQSAAVALGHARTAEDAAILSTEYAGVSADHAHEADTARAAAVEARTDAGAAADDAETARDDARTARTDAQTARGDSITARDDARIARTDAQTARGDSITARDDARIARTEAQAARDVALSAQMLGTLLANGTDIATIYTAGVFRVTAANLANVTGLPVSRSGVLEVRNLTGGANASIQRYTPYGTSSPAARGYYERQSVSSTAWGPWRYTPPMALTNPTDQPGFTAATWDDVNGRELNLAPTFVSIAAADLNSITLPGTYHQGSSASALLSRNYPVAERGVLEVIHAATTSAGIGSNGSFVLQRYTVLAGSHRMRGVYQRRAFFDNGAYPFEAWTFTPTQRVDQTVGRAIYTWDPVNAREQLIYGDTGWRDISSLLLAGWTGTLRMRRTTNHVSIRGLVTRAADGPSDHVFPLQVGFRAYSPDDYGVAIASGATTPNARDLASNNVNLFLRGAPQGTAWRIFADFDVIEAWPTINPGTAAGSIPT